MYKRQLRRLCLAWPCSCAGRSFWLTALSDNQVSYWNVDQLDQVAHNTHHDEAHAHGSDQLQVLLLRRLGALLDEPGAVLHELHWSVGDFLDVCHNVLCVCCCSLPLAVAVSLSSVRRPVASLSVLNKYTSQLRRSLSSTLPLFRSGDVIFCAWGRSA